MKNEDLLKSVIENASAVKDLTIVGSNELIDFDDIPVNKSNKSRPISDLNNWTMHDFMQFIKKAYLERGYKNWDLNMLAGANELLKLHDNLVDTFSFCDNRLLFDYIRYFLNNNLEKYLAHRKTLFIKDLRNKEMLNSFFESGYNYRDSAIKNLNKDIKIEKKKNSNFNLLSDIQKKYSMGYEDFVCSYGVILTTNWLINCKKFSKVDAIKYVILACVKSHSKGRIDEVLVKTEKLSPYPDWFLFKKANQLLKKIDSNLMVNVDFVLRYNKLFDQLRSSSADV